MKIKEMKIEDFLANKATILQLLIETYQSNFNISYEQSTKICNEKLECIPDYLFQKSAILIGAYDGEILVGFLWLYEHKYFNELRLHINQIIIAKQFRGKGIGKQLMTEVEKFAIKNGIKAIDLFVTETNFEAVNLYNSIGFITERRYMKKVL